MPKDHLPAFFMRVCLNFLIPRFALKEQLFHPVYLLERVYGGAPRCARVGLSACSPRHLLPA